MADPHLAYPVIHVTGTNGKGSTVQMISKLLMAQGLTVGTYTSPHLERINERIKRNGEPITEEESRSEQVLAYVAAFELLRAEDKAAKDRFAELHQKYPEDPLVNLHWQRIQEGFLSSTIVLAEK